MNLQKPVGGLWCIGGVVVALLLLEMLEEKEVVPKIVLQADVPAGKVENQTLWQHINVLNIQIKYIWIRLGVVD